MIWTLLYNCYIRKKHLSLKLASRLTKRFNRCKNRNRNVMTTLHTLDHSNCSYLVRCLTRMLCYVCEVEWTARECQIALMLPWIILCNKVRDSAELLTDVSWQHALRKWESPLCSSSSVAPQLRIPLQLSRSVSELRRLMFYSEKIRIPQQ